MSPLGLHLRSYGTDRTPDAHDFAQIVLPLDGGLHMEIAGKPGSVDTWGSAFVAAGAQHSQVSETANRSIILDLDTTALTPDTEGRLFERTFRTLSPEARHLVGYMGLLAGRGAADQARLNQWVPLLIDSLALEAPRAASRLSALMAAVETEPGRAWTAARMAAYASLSPSRLHALFREHHDTTPRAWLQAIRVQHACAMLAEGVLPIAEIALRGGFADQSALTRALRDATGLTPAAWRRRAQEAGQESGQDMATKKQETASR